MATEADARIHARAIAYVENVRARLRALKGPAAELTDHDLGLAFVEGYAAGLEDGRSAVGRRTVGRR